MTDIRTIRHLTCGGPAFLYEGLPQVGDVMVAERARTLTGEPVKAGDEAVCGSCGDVLKAIDATVLMVDWDDNQGDER